MKAMPSSLDDVEIYYLLRQGSEKEEGPFSLRQLWTMKRNSEVSDLDQYAVDGMEAWEPVWSLVERKPEPKGVTNSTTRESKAEQKASSETSGFFVAAGVVSIVILTICLIISRSPASTTSGGHLEHLVEELDPFVRSGSYPRPDKAMAVVIPATLGDRVKQDAAVMRAYRTATNYVSDMLISPATAQFSPIEKTGVKFESNYTRVAGYVDSQNGFGAMIRSKFTILFYGEQNSGQLRVDAVKVTGPMDEALGNLGR